MRRFLNKATAVVAGTAVVATLGLTACGASQDASSSESTEEATAQDAASESTVEKYNLQKGWMFQDEDSSVYYFEGADQKTGAYLWYYKPQNIYMRWAGNMEVSGNTFTITDDESGEKVIFDVATGDDDSIAVTPDGGMEMLMSPIVVGEVGDILDTIGILGKKPGEGQGVTPGSTVDQYNLEKGWNFQDADSVVYYFEGADQKTGAYLWLYLPQNIYMRWVGNMEVSGNTFTITDDESGEKVVFDVVPGDDDSIAVTPDGGMEMLMSPIVVSEVGDVLDDIGDYASKAGEGVTPLTAEELGGEHVIQINAEGDGEVGYVQGDETADYADSTFTLANKGDTITLMAKAGKNDSSSKFVKWTKDGADFSTEAEVEVTVDGDAAFVAVFE